jgi:hypothetical protein
MKAKYIIIAILLLVLVGGCSAACGMLGSSGNSGPSIEFDMDHHKTKKSKPYKYKTNKFKKRR